MDFVVRSTALPEPVALELTRRTAAGLAYMHGRGYAHRDMSLENVVRGRRGEPKVVDFGLVVALHPAPPGAPPRAVCAQSPAAWFGKDRYMPPEIVRVMAYYADRVDVWCLGVMLLVMLSGSPLWNFWHAESEVWAAVSGGLLREHLAPDVAISPATAALLQRMMALDPLARPTAAELLEEPALAPREGVSLLDDDEEEAAAAAAEAAEAAAAAAGGDEMML